MSGRTQSPTKRLIQEIRSYEEQPEDALLRLGPVSEDDLMHWSAVLKGVVGTAYEGTIQEQVDGLCAQNELSIT